MDSELEALLRGEGRLDSSGSFTLDASKARVKLGRFHLPPGLWAASLVQAGVAAGAQKIELQCKDMLLGRGTRVTYRGLPPRAFVLDAIMKGLEEPLSLAAGSPEAYLTEGILASGSAPAWLRVGKSGREVLRQQADAVECWRSGDSGPEKGELELDAELPTSTLRKRCQYSHVPVYVGGDRIFPRWDSPLEGVVFHLAVQSWGDGAQPLYLPAPRVPMVRVGSEGPTTPNPLDEGVFLDQQVGSEPWDSGILLPISLAGPATIEWVRHGAVVGLDQADLNCPGARVVASAHVLETDLSRFQLARTEAYHRRVQVLTERARSLLDELAAHRDRLRVPDHTFGAADTAATVMVGSSAGLMGLAAAGIITWPLSMLGMCLGSPVAGWLAFKSARARLERTTTARIKRMLWPEER